MRLISDKTRFGFIMDVFVDPAHRGKGIASGMVKWAIESPALKDVYKWALVTADAQAVYAKVGFGPLPFPERWMVFGKEKVRP